MTADCFEAGLASLTFSCLVSLTVSVKGLEDYPFTK